MPGHPTPNSLWKGALLIALAVAAPILRAGVPEYELKAALVYKIGKFVRWPEGTFAGPNANLRICLWGRDDFGSSIDRLNGQKLQGQTVAVERLAAAPDGAAACQIVFVSRSMQAQLPQVLSALAVQPTLTVSDIDGFAEQGGMVELATTDSKIHFQINPAASRRAGIEIGAQLLQLATLVPDARGAKP